MPKYSKEMEEKIIAAFEQGKRNSVISRELSIDRGALPRRRKEWEKGKQAQEKPETKTEKPFQQETDSHPLDPEIYTLMRHQGAKSREVAISQAIETQTAFNPYLLNHGLKTPKALVKHFEDELQIERTNFKDVQIDLNIEKAISRGMIKDQIEEIIELEATIADLKKVGEQRFEEGLEQGRDDNAIYFRCVHCGKIIQVKPQSEIHGVITRFLLDAGWGHDVCVRRDEYDRGTGSRALNAEIYRF